VRLVGGPPVAEHPPLWLDGRLVHPADAVVSVFDHGLTVGDGVFETLKAVDGTAFAVRRHLERLRRSAGGLGLTVPFSDDELRAAIAEVAAGAPELARIRVTVTGGAAPLGSERGEGGATVVVAAGALAAREEVTAVAVVPWTRNEAGAVAGLKTTSYAENVVALAEARRRGATEAVLANTRGDLCEGTGSNVFVVLDGELCTPPLSSGCLAGITRELVIGLTGAREVDLPLSVLDHADEVLLTSSGRDVQGVHHVDDRALDAPGPVTKQAMAAYADLAASDPDP
jgi:branched-chain amino acid aminotransferase